MGSTPPILGRLLFAAAASGNLDECRRLLGSGADANHVTRSGLTPLYAAVIRGHREVVELLLEKGALVDAKSRKGLAPIHAALWAKTNKREIVDLLLRGGANIHQQAGPGLTALHGAAINGDREMVELLLERGAKPEFKAKGGLSAVHYAAARGQAEVMEKFLERPANLSLRTWGGDTLLHTAALHGQTKVAQLLIAKGARINVRDKDGFTPLNLAIIRDHAEMVEVLLGAGADLEAGRDGIIERFSAETKKSRVAEIILQHRVQQEEIGPETGNPYEDEPDPDFGSRTMGNFLRLFYGREEEVENPRREALQKFSVASLLLLLFIFAAVLVLPFLGDGFGKLNAWAENHRHIGNLRELLDAIEDAGGIWNFMGMVLSPTLSLGVTLLIAPLWLAAIFHKMAGGSLRLMQAIREGAPPLMFGSQPEFRETIRYFRKLSGLALASAVFGGLSVVSLGQLAVLPFAGIICGHVALNRIEKSKGKIFGRQMARKSLWVNWIALGVAIGVWIYLQLS